MSLNHFSFEVRFLTFVRICCQSLAEIYRTVQCTAGRNRLLKFYLIVVLITKLLRYLLNYIAVVYFKRFLNYIATTYVDVPFPGTARPQVPLRVTIFPLAGRGLSAPASYRSLILKQ